MTQKSKIDYMLNELANMTEHEENISDTLRGFFDCTGCKFSNKEESIPSGGKVCETCSRYYEDNHEWIDA